MSTINLNFLLFPSGEEETVHWNIEEMYIEYYKIFKYYVVWISFVIHCFLRGMVSLFALENIALEFLCLAPVLRCQ